MKKLNSKTLTIAGVLVALPLLMAAGLVAQSQIREAWEGSRLGGGYAASTFIEFNKDTDLNTTDATYTVTNSTAPTTVTHANTGTAAFTNAGADNDRVEVDETAEWIKLTDGIIAHFQVKATFSDATQADYGFGIGIIDTDWLGDSAIMSDGIFIEKNDGDTNIDLVIAYNASSTSDYVREAAIATADTSAHVYDIVVQMDPSVDGAGRVIVFIDGAKVLDKWYASGLPYDEELCMKYGVQNGEAVAKTLTLDFLGAAVNRAA